MVAGVLKGFSRISLSCAFSLYGVRSLRLVDSDRQIVGMPFEGMAVGVVDSWSSLAVSEYVDRGVESLVLPYVLASISLPVGVVRATDGAGPGVC